MKTKEEIIEQISPNRPWDKGGKTDAMILKCMQEYADQSKWVSVEERLPEIDTDIWCAINNRVLLNSYRLWKSHSGEYLFLNYDHPFGDREVTHWMPIQSPPQS